MLAEGIEQYVFRRRSEGLGFERGVILLDGLSNHVGSVQLEQVTTKHVLEYLDSLAIATNTWRLKYQMLLRFFDFWAARGALSGLTMPPQRPKVRQSFVPYIYSRAELRSLLHAIREKPKPIRGVDPQTWRTFILLLYGTGALTGEVLNLKDKHVNLATGMLTIESVRSNRSREIPIGRDLKDVLQKYRNWRLRRKLHGEHFLVNRHDHPVSSTSGVVCFDRLRRLAGIGQHDGINHPPRLNDLKFTFAVHRITSWIRNGADLDRMLPALAAYMGQVDLGATERYLAMTPERFRKDLNKLSPTRGKGRWRDKPELMRFIASL
jgi:integrase/recombinase XerD